MKGYEILVYNTSNINECSSVVEPMTKTAKTKMKKQTNLNRNLNDNIIVPTFSFVLITFL